jgi:hypothetical protein
MSLDDVNTYCQDDDTGSRHPPPSPERGHGDLRSFYLFQETFFRLRKLAALEFRFMQMQRLEKFHGLSYAQTTTGITGHPLLPLPRSTDICLKIPGEEPIIAQNVLHPGIIFRHTK